MSSADCSAAPKGAAQAIQQTAFLRSSFIAQAFSKFFEEFFLLGVEAGGRGDGDDDAHIPPRRALQNRRAFAAQMKDGAGLGAGRNLEFLGAAGGGHGNFRAQRRLPDVNRHF